MSGYVTTTVFGYDYVAPSLPPGSPALGSEIVEGGAGGPYPSTNILRLVRYNPAGVLGSLPIGGVVKYVGLDIVDGTNATTDTMDGVNDIGAKTQVVPVGNYFWMNTHGNCKPLVAAAQAAGIHPGCTATPFTLGAPQAGLNTNIRLLAASGGGGQTLTNQK